MNDKRTNKNMMQVQEKTKIASDTSALLAALSWSHEDAAALQENRDAWECLSRAKQSTHLHSPKLCKE